MGTIGGNLLLDTRCNYYDQTVRVAASDRLLHEEGRRDLLGGSVEPPLLGRATSDGVPVAVALGAEVTLAVPRRAAHPSAAPSVPQRRH